MNIPYLFIVSGPTGAGKSFLFDKINNYLDLGVHKNEVVEVIIDDLIEKNPGYVNDITQIIKRNCNNRIKFCNTLKHKISTIDKELLQDFETSYFTNRKESDCDTGYKLTKRNKRKKSCDEKNDDIFHNALKQGKHVLFETTGTFFPDWIFEAYNDILNSKRYRIVVAWSFSSVQTLLKRNKTRTVKGIKKFIRQTKNRHNSSNRKRKTIKKRISAPRLPDISEKKYISNLKKIIHTFKNTIRNKSNIYNHIRYLVFNNNTKNSGKKTIAYDSHIDERKKGDIVNTIIQLKKQG